MKCRGDDGLSASIFVAMLAVLVLGLGGLSADLWRVIAARGELVGHVDAAAAAGATAVDEGRLYIDPLDHALDAGEATRRVCSRLARAHALASGVCPGAAMRVDVADRSVSVIVEREVELPLLGLLVPGSRPAVVIRVVSTVDVLRGSP
jgi:hypothetical protein